MVEGGLWNVRGYAGRVYGMLRGEMLRYDTIRYVRASFNRQMQSK